jgi:hypothetical protein
MAIPFALPSDEEAEDQSQQLEQLMLDLYAALQQVLRARNAQHPSRNREYSFLWPFPTPPTSFGLLALPEPVTGSRRPPFARSSAPVIRNVLVHVVVVHVVVRPYSCSSSSSALVEAEAAPGH